MSRISAGILVYRRAQRAPMEILLVHPGGPFWKNKDLGAWSIPKGEVKPGEDLLATAQREFEEETSYAAPGPFVELTPVKQKSGKIVHAWACEADIDVAACQSNTFRMEWPPKSGKWAEFPEVDCAAYFAIELARQKIIPEQAAFIDELVELIESAGRDKTM